MELVTRRQGLVLAAAATGCLATRAMAAETRGATGGGLGQAAASTGFKLETIEANLSPYKDSYGGKGQMRLKTFFSPDGFSPKGVPSAPAAFFVYELAPGSSEGTHTHNFGSPLGALDEYYFIVEGSGQMEIDGQVIPVKAGDHVHTPIGVKHGIENTHPTQNLVIYLTALYRT